MIDLREARISLDSYAARLELHSLQFGLAVSLREVEKRTPDAEPTATSMIDNAAVELKQVRRESIVLSILISQAIENERASCSFSPHEIANLVKAQNRIATVWHKVRTLLDKYDLEKIEKKAPPKESEAARAIREFLEKHRAEGSSLV